MRIDVPIVTAVSLGIALGSTIASLIERWPAKREPPHREVQYPSLIDTERSKDGKCTHPHVLYKAPACWVCAHCHAVIRTF